MKFSNALRVLSELSSSQWGMITAAQASRRGVKRLELSRLTEGGHLVRLAHGVYRDAGAPSDEFADLRAAWLSTEPDKLAEDRLGDISGGVVITGASAARLHGVGDLPADRHEFSSSVRRQTQRSEIHYRQRSLEAHDATIVIGLPVTTIERTIADLLEARTDLSLVADVLSDASRLRRLDLSRLAELLAPLAARQGFRKGDGAALLNRLMEIAGLELNSLARRIAASPNLGALVAANFLEHSKAQADIVKLFATPAMVQAIRSISESISKSLIAGSRQYLNSTSSATMYSTAKNLDLDRALCEAIAPAMAQFAAMASITKNVNLDLALRDAMPAMAQFAASDSFRSLSNNWPQLLGVTALPKINTIALVQTALQVANNG